ncbi:hypothetical protein BO70DRAFT_378750 [Aspergillus heteromorphus CBS 117.55]|uniref:Uncharacterized protein n=1 Tax=Aspergillus heteromorphus CBS 117.55 TaxID=1448321 RepID=A0A317WI72_9EURO|nr:uncharacterized protein BO70DRAFT_378750 [Aspergillus heteromorphus CBS 117.55]PWY86083.1 hypothetical protein BO70DRAFT_378750 [Aspergillus heteromorphus CBS 117.55]
MEDDGALFVNNDDDDLSDQDATYIDSDEDGSGDSLISQSPETQALKRSARNLHAAGSPPPYRPNRFPGAESTWRTLTARDRQNARALDDIRARDLAAHLYNAYALRIRAIEMAKRATKMKSKTSSETDGFLPPRRWTAWPLPSDEVPRPGEERLRGRRDDLWAFKMQPDPRPSAELEESVMAVMLKTAKERFMARDWEPRVRNYASHQRKTSASQPETQDESTAGESERELANDTPLRPVVQADDEKSYRQLRPLTRNVLNQLDDLLMGLHRARKGGAMADDSDADEWLSDSTGSTGSGSSPKKRKVDRRRERSQSRGRKRTRLASVLLGSSSSGTRSPSAHTTSDAPSRSERSDSSSRSRSASVNSDERRSDSRLRLGIRDWSEVLGVAAMTGWPPAVVMRTAQRCANLFGEDMAFHILKEGNLQQTHDDDTKIWKYAESESEPDAAPAPEPNSEHDHEHEDESESASESKPVQPQPQPESKPSPPPQPELPPPPPPPPSSRSRPSSQKPRSRPTSSKRGSTSRANSTAPEDGEDPSQPKGKGEHRKNDIVCPIQTCSRHGKGFSRTWNLNLHMKRMHPNYRAKSAERRSETGTPPPPLPLPSHQPPHRHHQVIVIDDDDDDDDDD